MSCAYFMGIEEGSVGIFPSFFCACVCGCFMLGMRKKTEMWLWFGGGQKQVLFVRGILRS